MSEEIQFGNVDAILAASDVKTAEMDVPEWGCKIRVRGLTKRQQPEIREEATRGRNVDADIVTLLMFIEGVVEPKFERKHFGQLQEKAAGVIDRVVAKVVELSGITPEDQRAMSERFQ